MVTDLATWSKHLPWAEYAFNTQTGAVRGLSHLEASLAYQPPMFPQEEEIVLSSVHLCCCQRIWKLTWRLLLRTIQQIERYTNTHWTPDVVVHQEHRESWKMTPQLIGPFPIMKMINLVTICLKLLASMRTHPVFHVSQVKPHTTSPLQPPDKAPLPPRTIEGATLYTVHGLLDVQEQGRGFQLKRSSKMRLLGGGTHKMFRFLPLRDSYYTQAVDWMLDM